LLKIVKVAVIVLISGNGGFNKCVVTRVNQVQFFNQTFVLVDSFLLQNPALLKPPDRWQQSKKKQNRSPRTRLCPAVFVFCSGIVKCYNTGISLICAIPKVRNTGIFLICAIPKVRNVSLNV